MTKQDLKTGMWVCTEDNRWGMILLNTQNGNIISGKDMWCPLDTYNSDLTCSCFSFNNIIKVVQPQYNQDYLNMYSEFNNIIWER